MLYDVVIVGGGPAGLSAALMLGRALRRVVLFDAGPPRNAAADLVHGFVTRDGTPPAELRRIAREELRAYESVEVRDARVGSITREGEVFRLRAASDVRAASDMRAASDVREAIEVVEARRVLLCLGMVDELPAMPGYRELWGRSVFQCPYCHGWEARGRAFGCLVSGPAWLEWAMFLRAWTRDVIVFTGGAFEVPAETRAKLERAHVPIEERRIKGLRADAGRLAAVELEDGSEVARDILFARPPQRQVDLVSALGLALDEQGFVRVDERRQTSIPGIYAAGDLTTMLQGALVAAGAGAMAASMLNHALTMELVASGEL